MSLSLAQACALCIALAALAGLATPAHGESPTRVTPESLRVAHPAPQPGGVLTLERTLELATAHHPRLRAAAWRLRASNARRTDAGRWPNPTAGLDFENLGGDLVLDRLESTLWLGQTFELGGDRGARAGLAEAFERLAWSELSTEEREVLAEAAGRFIETWTLQERAARLAGAERLAGLSVAAAAERFRAGAGPAFEQARAEAVQALRRSERVRVAAELASSRQRLAAAWGGVAVAFDSLALAPPRMAPIPGADSLAALLEAHPARRRAAAEVALEEARRAEARAARVPDLDLMGGVRRIGDPAGTTVVLGASMPLPIWNAQRGGVAAAEAEREAAAVRAESVGLELRTALRDACERYEATGESYRLIAEVVRPKSEEVLRQIASGYRGGRYSSLELFAGQNSLLDAELQMVEAVAEAWRARLALERLLGQRLEGLGMGGER